mmetsp:Transcript_18560/g.16443  ORF Transcript_18560/g.16443 Transcript_18560/m.16443 type:complete len:125 (+) Transcript_18560:423-797(+)
MYIKAQKIRRVFCQQYNDVFTKSVDSCGKGVDILLSPNAVGEIPTVSSILNGEIDPVVGEYSQDYYTVPSNVSGAPSLCLPMETVQHSLGVSQKPAANYKLWGRFGYDNTLLSIGKLVDSAVKN